MELLDQFYNCICCQAKPQYPDPYTFDFGNESSLTTNSKMFQSNQIKTTKYNVLNFLPKSIINQYKRLANLYFLTVACITTIPGVTPLNPALIWLPLVIVLFVSIIKEAYQDYHRNKVDKQINNLNTTSVLRNQQLVSLPWSQIVVGDICLIKEDEAFPADLLLLSTGEDDGIAYIETGSLDGEKTSKIRYAFSPLATKYKTLEEVQSISGTYNGEIPTLSLDHLRGTLVIRDQQLNILDNKQLLYRGAKLKNTKQVWGLVLYAGQCSKIMLNSQISSGKITVIEKRLNVLLVSLFVCQIIICIVMTVLSIRMEEYLLQNANYLSWGAYKPSSKTFIKNFMMFFIEYSSIIPVSLIVSIEIAKLAQSYFIDFDKLMYCETKQRGALARNTALNEQLGQIQYVFTDKTGTLTSNKMTFHSAVIGNRKFQFKHLLAQKKAYFSQQFQLIHQSQTQIQLLNPINLISDDKQVLTSIITEKQLQHNYLMALLTCNAINAVSKDGQTIFQSQSPDQIALIKFAQSLNYVFIKRQTSNLIANVSQKKVTIKVIEKFNFSSERKRMSVLIQFDGNILLYAKGADNVISERIKPSIFKIPEKIQELSKNGLRTLMVAMKVVSPSQFTQYNKAIAQAEFSKRDQVRQYYADKFESNLDLIGATALLDQLQVGVPQTLRDLQRANIKVWMLTGDKLQTAIQVSKSCHLIEPNYKIIQCKPSPRQIGHFLDQWQILVNLGSSKYSLVIQGSRLGQILSDDQYSKKFAFLSQQFVTVICCRLLPIQKAHVVKLIRTHLNQVCLAIGDGGNDVSMIKQAHIGIGLYGQEGMSAVQASDYAIPEFRMIWRLIFVHGRWNYLRISEMILYFSYKSILFTIPKMIFSTFNGYSGQPLFDDYYIALYNVLFTSVPLLIRALFQQDVNYVIQKRQAQGQENGPLKQKSTILIQKQQKFLPKGFQIDHKLRKLFPKIYFIGKNNQIFNLFNCLLWVGEAAILGVIATYLSVEIIGSRPINKHGYNSDLWMVSITIYSIVIILNTIKISMHVRHWTGMFLFAVLACSMAPYLIYMWISNYSLSKYVAGTVIMSYQSYLTYFIVALVCILSIIIISVIIYLHFHSNKMIKKIRLRMLDYQSDQSLSQASEDPLQRSQIQNNGKVIEGATWMNKNQCGKKINISPAYLALSKIKSMQN